MEEAITSLTGYLDILPTVLERNTIPLDSTIFDLVEKLSENYDYILMDTAPVGLAANTMSLNQVATNALFVVRFDTSSVQEIRDALDRLDKSGVRLLGSIFNGVKVSESGMRKHQKETYAQTLAKEEKDSQNILEEAINETQPDNSEETFIPSEEPEDIQETLAYNATTEDFIRQLMKVEMQENEPMRADSDTPEDGDADEEK
jgi:MinD-like ATPase involved in chromosome partitioning or flagellar assembly